MIPAILHAGASKCGSSALQRALSLQPCIQLKTESHAHYGAILGDASFKHGADLKRAARTSLAGYLNCLPAARLLEFTKQQFDQIKSEIECSLPKGDTLILSNEGFLGNHAILKQSNALAKLNLDVHVILYVRPQVPLMNSAWWQWGAWTDKPLDEYVASRLERCKWTQAAQHMRSLNGVSNVSIRLLKDDIVENFLHFIGATNTANQADRFRNRSLPGTILRIFQRQPHLRPGPRDGDIDFVLEKHFNDMANPAPWVIHPKLAAAIVETVREDNHQLLDCLDEEDRTHMLNDPRWWDASSFDAMKLELLPLPPPSQSEMELYLSRSFETIFKLEKQMADAARSMKLAALPSELHELPQQDLVNQILALSTRIDELSSINLNQQKESQKLQTHLATLKEIVQSAIDWQSSSWLKRTFRRWRTTPKQRSQLAKL